MQLTSIKKISYIQLAVLFAASRLFSEAMNFPLTTVQYGMQRFTVILTAYAILFVQYIPLICLSAKYPGKSAVGIIIDKNKVLGWVYAILLTVSVLIASISSMCRMKFYASSTIFGQAPEYLLIILPLIACAFAVWKGIQATARSGVIFAAVFVGFLILVAISTWDMFNTKWLYPNLIDRKDTFWGEVAEQIGSNSEIIYFSVLAEHISEKSQRTVYWYVPAVMLILELMYLLEILLLGPFVGSANFPFFTVSALSNIVLFQRLDGIDVAVWTLMCIGKKAGIIAALACIVITAAASVAFGGSSDFVIAVTAILTCGIPMITCGALFPLIALIMAKIGSNKKNKGAKANV